MDAGASLHLPFVGLAFTGSLEMGFAVNVPSGIVRHITRSGPLPTASGRRHEGVVLTRWRAGWRRLAHHWDLAAVSW